ncbi:hypothetical protein KQX54_010850 [Cotesia glomerata]|uniref:Uncharacterized protein n=1 Tax=Cotesia glomerata TaxID=32391 RepID=A0AAV7J031_COTGL|nr:hypothetical protein KQX54_010850 [Cotesia glomerata]
MIFKFQGYEDYKGHKSDERNAVSAPFRRESNNYFNGTNIENRNYSSSLARLKRELGYEDYKGHKSDEKNAVSAPFRRASDSYSIGKNIENRNNSEALSRLKRELGYEDYKGHKSDERNARNNSEALLRLKRELGYEDYKGHKSDERNAVSAPFRRSSNDYFARKSIENRNNSEALSRLKRELVRNFFQAERDKLKLDRIDSGPLKITLEKLHAADIIRDNVIFVMGFMLQLPPGTLSIEEYTSLELICNAIKRKSVYMYESVKLIHEGNNKSILDQLLMFFNTIKNQVVFFMKSSVEFWIDLLKHKRNRAIQNHLDHNTFNLIAGIPKQMIDSVANKENHDISKELVVKMMKEPGNELAKYEITGEIMGPVYVELFYGLTSKVIPFTQELFGNILRDLPNEDADPIFDEYIAFVSREMWQNTISKWPTYFTKVVAYDPYRLVISTVDKIAADKDVPYKLKKALLYIRDHLITGGRGLINHEIENSYRITENGLNVNLLFESTITCDCSNRIIDMRDKLQKYLGSNLDQDIFVGINRYRYNNPHDLMLGFLARLQMRSSTEVDKKISRIISILLSYLFYQRNVHYYHKFKSNISFWMIVDIIDNPIANSTISQTIESILTDLMNDLKTWDRVEPIVMQSVINTNKTHLECITLEMLTKLKEIAEEKHLFAHLPAKIDKLINDVRNSFTEYDSFEDEDKLEGKLASVKPSRRALQTSDDAEKEQLEEAEEDPKPTKRGKLKKLKKRVGPMIKELKQMLKPAKKFFKRKLISKIAKSRVDLSSRLPARRSLGRLGLSIGRSLTGLGLRNSKWRVPINPLNSMISSVNQPFATKLPALPPIASLSKNISTLPPVVQPNECIVITTNVGTVKILPTVFTRSNGLTGDPDTLVFPSMVDLDEQPGQDLLEHVSGQCVQHLRQMIIQPLIKVFGENYAEVLLGKFWANKYSTRMAALVALMRTAQQVEQVAEDTKLMENIRNVLASLEIIAPYLFLPLLIRSKNFNGKIVWSTVSTKDLSVSILGRDMPDYEDEGTITVPLLNPAFWLLPVEQNSDPFQSLLPHFEQESRYAEELKPLLDVFELGKVTALIGHDIDLSRFPSRGALFVWTLFQLMSVEEVRMQPPLLRAIQMHWKAIQQPAFSIRIPRDVILGETQEKYSNWAVDLVGLMGALPSPADPQQEKLWTALKNYLSRSNLLEELSIPSPPLHATKARFLDKIIERSLKIHDNRLKVDAQTRAALLFYRDKIMVDREGARQVGWIWSQKFTGDMLTEHDDSNSHFGEMMEQYLPYYKMTREKQRAYNDLVEHLYMKPHLLDLKDDFLVKNYQTKGSFVRGVLEYIAVNPEVSSEIKRDILMLLPEVLVDGRNDKHSFDK